jgi:ankyrin repeat protein
MSDLLASAAARGDIEICQILIEAGADLDAPSGHMRTTALHRALIYNNLACVRMLLQAGANPNLVADGKTPLHIACSNHDSLGIVNPIRSHVNPLQDCGCKTVAARPCTAHPSATGRAEWQG